MDVAVCTENNHSYYVIEFSHLPPDELLHKRQLLICPECGGPAYFRKASKSGQVACFGARPHAQGCILAASDHLQIINDGQGEDQEIFEESGKTIVIDLNYGAKPESECRLRGSDETPSKYKRLGSHLSAKTIARVLISAQ